MVKTRLQENNNSVKLKFFSLSHLLLVFLVFYGVWCGGIFLSLFFATANPAPLILFIHVKPNLLQQDRNK